MDPLLPESPDRRMIDMDVNVYDRFDDTECSDMFYLIAIQVKQCSPVQR